MLTQTSELAIRTLVFLTLEGERNPQSPRQIADRIDCSVSYLAKILRTLVGVGILYSVRGARGGVLLSREPAEISLLSIVEACQGMLVGDYCQAQDLYKNMTCSYHHAMNELHQVTVQTLSKWTIADLVICPVGLPTAVGDDHICKMEFEGCDKYISLKNGKACDVRSRKQE